MKWNDFFWIATFLLLSACQSLYHLDGVGDTSPFENIEWKNHDDLHVQVEGTWYQLLEIEGIPLQKIIQVAKVEYGFHWKRRIVGDTTAVMSLLGESEFFNVELTLKDQETQDIIKLTSSLDKKQILLENLRLSQRVLRPHSTLSDPRFTHLTTRLYGFPTSDQLQTEGHLWLSVKQAQEDLDQLEASLVHHFSYLKLHHVDYQSALDTIKNGLQTGIHQADFGFQMMKFLALFGDGHTRLSFSRVFKQTDIDQISLPFRLKEVEGKVVALSAPFKFYNPDYPFLKSIDDLSVEKLRQEASLYLARGSVRTYATRKIITLLPVIRREQGIMRDHLKVILANQNGLETTIILNKNNTLPDYESSDFVSYSIMKHNIGYLRIKRMGKSFKFLKKLEEAMASFQDTKGLIIDIRDNAGGSRKPTLTLLPYFLIKPHVINVASLRIDANEDPQVDESYNLEPRFLYPRKSKIWSDAEKEAIDQWLATHSLQWDLAKGEFSKLHFTVVSPQANKTYHKPLVILMNENNFSASDIFLGAFKGLPRVKLVGVKSAGGSGYARRYYLLNSFYDPQASRIASFQNTGELYEGNGVAPDIWVDNTIESIQQNQDIQLQKAKELLVN